MRPFDTRNGKPLKKGPNLKGDYQDTFSEYIANAIRLYLSKPPRIEDCKAGLPASVLAKLQAQIKSHRDAAGKRAAPELRP